MTLRSPSRRGALKGAAGIALMSVFQAWQLRAAQASVNVVASPYGPVAPVKDGATGLELLQLPAGFKYETFGWTNDAMKNGQPGPGAHDGMAVVSADGKDHDHHRRHDDDDDDDDDDGDRGNRSSAVLIRNHELGLGEPIPAPARYDTAFINAGAAGIGYPAGGNTLLVFRGHKWREVVPALGGTLANCCGGPTPWGSWLTCEETMVDLRPLGGLKHGYVFEVRSDPEETTGNPIVGMGRMSHEAAAVDGASAWRRFWSITFPYIRGLLMLALLFRTIEAFKLADLVILLTKGGNDTMTISYHLIRIANEQNKTSAVLRLTDPR